MPSARPLIATAAAGSIAVVGALLAPLPAAGADSICAAVNDAVYERVKPTTGANLVTTSAKEAAGASSYGFTQDTGTAFLASTTAAPGLVPAHRLFRSSPQDFMISANQAEWTSARTNHGYQDQGTKLYVSPRPADCLVPVTRFVYQGKHRLAASETVRAELLRKGWKSEGVAFYAAPATAPAAPAPPPASVTDTKFSFAVYPDTQQEVFGDSRFINRTNWLVKNKTALDLRFVTHSGDVVNWDTPNHDQYAVASKAMAPLEQARIPYSMAIGNHDTQATTVGGVARDPKNTRRLQRDTTTFNRYFTASRYGGVSGAFETGKVDNIYSLYEAGGVKWMVLVLELWPRQAVVDWAKAQVAAHPKHNVVVVTHSYLSHDGYISGSAGYGDTSPQQLYAQLVSRYPNIRMTFSGHVGAANHRVDTGVHGNKIHSFLTTFHSNTANPTRLVEVDTKAGSLKTWIYSPSNNVTQTQYTKNITGLALVR